MPFSRLSSRQLCFISPVKNAFVAIENRYYLSSLMHLFKNILPVLALFGIVTSSHAQNMAEHQIMETIETMFDGMRALDADMVASTFADGAVLNSSGERDRTPYVRNSTASGFVAALRNAANGPFWDERIWNVIIEVEDNLATAWMDFAFYAGENFSHCGTNTFQLARGADGAWKTVALADTRKAGQCLIDQNDQEEAMVRTALRHYLRGHATGQGSEHEQAFNEVASLYWMNEGALQTRTSAAYIAGAPGKPADNESERNRYIDWVDVSGTAAVAKIVLDYPGAYFVDYMSLLKVDGRWQIVNKIFDVDRE